MTGVFKRGARYWFRFTWEGKQRFVNLGTDSEVDAINAAIEELKKKQEEREAREQAQEKVKELKHKKRNR
jgi:cell shape-determining protein MreC